MASGDLQDLERRIEAVGAVHHVVQAIWALSRAQLPRIEEAAAEASTYLDWVNQIVDRLAGAARPGSARGWLCVVMGPERPFCGALAHQILLQAPKEGALGLVGNRLAELAALDPALTKRIRFSLPGAVSHEEHETVGQAVAEAVLRHGTGLQVEVLYPRGGGTTLHRVVLLSGEREPAWNPPETYSAYAEVLGAAVAEAVAGRLAIGAIEALWSEVRARVLAADAARRACEMRIEALNQDWRVARQDQITNELIEVVAARAAALDRKGAQFPKKPNFSR